MKIEKWSRLILKQLQPEITKRLRSNIPCRRRSHISPLVLNSSNSISGSNFAAGSEFSVDSSSADSLIGGRTLCSTATLEVEFPEGKQQKRMNKRRSSEFQVDESEEELGRRKKQKQNQSCRSVDVSESSCLDSNSGVRVHSASKLIEIPSDHSLVKEIGGIQCSGERNFSKSEISCVEQFSGEVPAACSIKFLNPEVTNNCFENDAITITSGVSHDQERSGYCEKSISGTENRASELFDTDHDHLACTEQLLSVSGGGEDDVISDNSSDLQSGIFSDIYFSDCTPSIFNTDSGSEFSIDDSTDPSPTFSLFRQYSVEFLWSSCAPDHSTGEASRLELHEHEHPHKLEFLRFEEVEDEESYQMLRKRERRQVYFCNFAENYNSLKEFGGLILQQRSEMVRWIIEQCSHKGLRYETMFLAVSLLDRFLSKGYFKAKRNLQIVGIACLTLAKRIEENQPYNSVRHKTFFVGSNLYSRCEVVAMEWMVQEVLSFQCFLPTIYNFLWFYLKAASANAEVEERVKYLAVVALSAYEQLCHWPSTVAAALVLLASLELNQDAPHKVIGIHVRSKDETLHKCIERLEWLLGYL